MATIRKRATKWQAQVRRKGYPPTSKTFLAKEDAGRVSKRGLWTGGEILRPLIDDKPRTFFSDLLNRYVREVSPKKRSPSDPYHLRSLTLAMGHLSMSELAATHFAAFRDARLAIVSPSTVRKEMTLFCSVLSVARAEWGEGIELEAFKRVRKPSSAKGRDRRLEAHECLSLLTVFQSGQNQLPGQVFRFAIATGMRRGEILSLVWSNVDLQSRVALLPFTKNGETRRVPLSTVAVEILRERIQAAGRRSECFIEASCEAVFPISANALRLAWDRARRKAGVKGLRFHDLRHEAVSRFFEMGLSVPEVALISGHKDVRMLFRYTQLRAEDVASKLV